MKLDLSSIPDIRNEFVIGKDKFSDLEICSAQEIEQLCYFRFVNGSGLVKFFILKRGKQVDCICKVTLIRKGNKFTPRLSFSRRDTRKRITEKKQIAFTNIKASVSLKDCYKEFWKLIAFLQSLQEIEIPEFTFSLVSQGEGAIISALGGKDPESLRNIAKQILSMPNVSLSVGDIYSLLNRKEKLEEFKSALSDKAIGEDWWQEFFEANKWIFGYGLNYQILKQHQSQPYYGGTGIDGKGAQRGDFMTSTVGDLRFTVLVEIKTHSKPLLHGKEEIRSGAWSLSKDLTDAVSQLQANIYKWEKEGSDQPDNRDWLEKMSVHTVQPKGIIVIGMLRELEERSKRETFQRFRKSIHGIDVLTFDELFARAKFIVENE